MNRLTRQLVAALKDQMAGGTKHPPEGGAILWNAFARLSRQRSYHMAGPNPISFAEIDAYCRVMRLPLDPRHIEVLIAMDRAWLDHAGTEPEKDRPPLTAAMFDAMFG